MNKIRKIVEEISWMPYWIRNQYFCSKDKIVDISFGNTSFPFEIIEDIDYHSLSRNLQAYRVREPRNIREYIKFVTKEDVVLDVGANIGFLLFFQRKSIRSLLLNL